MKKININSNKNKFENDEKIGFKDLFALCIAQLWLFLPVAFLFGIVIFVLSMLFYLITGHAR